MIGLYADHLNIAARTRQKKQRTNAAAHMGDERIAGQVGLFQNSQRFPRAPVLLQRNKIIAAAVAFLVAPIMGGERGGPKLFGKGGSFRLRFRGVRHQPAAFFAGKQHLIRPGIKFLAARPAQSLNTRARFPVNGIMAAEEQRRSRGVGAPCIKPAMPGDKRQQ